MKSRRLIYGILIVSVLLTVFSSIGTFLSNKPIQKEIVYAKVEIVDDNVAGFDVTKDFLNFGKIGKGSSSSRNLLFENKHDFVVNLEISSEGSISEVLSHPKILEILPGETREIPFSVFSEKKSDLRIYEGNIILEIK